MEFINSKISLEKNWKLTPRVWVLIILGIIVILGILILVWPKEEAPPVEINPKEKTMEEILKDLSVPEGKRGTVKAPSPEVMESLTPKKEAPQVPEEILKNLTAPK